MTVLDLRRQPEAPLEAGVISPDNLAGKSAAQILRLSLRHGNEAVELGEFFEVHGDGSAEIAVNGDLRRVRNLCAGMTAGAVTVHGVAGMHLGAGMSGGSIEVFGAAGDWAGAEMSGGIMRIHGNAGRHLGGAYPGSVGRMNRGAIIVEGDAGHGAGALMRRGLIVVTGNAGEEVGAFMTAGSILVFGQMGARAGIGLLRGSIIAFQTPELPATYRYDCSYRPLFLSLVLQELRRYGLPIQDAYISGCYRRYSGDFNRLGKGEILIYDQR